MDLIQYVETIEVPITSITQQRFYFGKRETLQDKIVVYCILNDGNDVSYSFNGRYPITGLVRFKAFLVLVSNDNVIINHYPLEYMINDYHMPIPVEINRIIDWEKSYVEVSNTDDLVLNSAIIFTFYCAEKLTPVPRGAGLNIEPVEIITTPASLLKYKLPDNERLKGKRIHHLGAITYNLTKTPSGYDRASDQTAFAFLTIVSNGNEIIRRLPLNHYQLQSFNGWKPIYDIIPDLPNSYIELPTNEYNVAGEAFTLFFHYWDKIT